MIGATGIAGQQFVAALDASIRGFASLDWGLPLGRQANDTATRFGDARPASRVGGRTESRRVGLLGHHRRRSIRDGGR